MEVVGPDHRHQPGSRSAVTIGAYDGVHLGHRAVLGELRALASDRNLETVVVTFDRHPASVVRPESAPYLLTDLAQKLDLLADCGVDRTLVLPFDRRRADEAAEEFIDEVLVEALGAQLVVVGTDFHFGHGRKGNVALLREHGAVLRTSRWSGLDCTTPRGPRCRRRASASSWPGATWLRRPCSSGGTTRCGARWCAETVAAAPELGHAHRQRRRPRGDRRARRGDLRRVVLDNRPGVVAAPPGPRIPRPSRSGAGRPSTGPRVSPCVGGAPPRFLGRSLRPARPGDVPPADPTGRRSTSPSVDELVTQMRRDVEDVPPPPRIRLRSGSLACGREDLPDRADVRSCHPRVCSLVEGVGFPRPG